MVVELGQVIEKAILPIKPGVEAEFEAAFAEAQWIIASMEGCREVVLSRGVENASTYLLLVRWDTVEHHEVGFRGSAEYEEWSALLHHFYEPFPVVEHFIEVNRVVR